MQQRGELKFIIAVTRWHQYAFAKQSLLLHGPCRQELVPLLLHMQHERAAMAAAQGAASDWEHYVACSPLPHPRDRPAMNDFLNSILLEVDTTDIQKTLQGSEVTGRHD